MFYFILISIIGLSYIFYKTKNNSFYYISLAFLFFLFAFEYGNSNDYWVYVSRFYVANGDYNHDFIKWYTEDERIEFIYKYLMILCKPIGFFGFCILLGFVEIYTLDKIIKRTIPIKYLWFFYTIFMLIPLYGLLLLNTKRQALAIVLILLGVIVQIRNFPHDNKLKNKNRLKEIFLFIILVIIAGNIHFSAYLGLIYLPIIYLKPKKINKIIIIFILLLFLFSYKFKIDAQVLSFILDDNSKYMQYLTEIGDSYNISTVYLIYDLFSLMLVLYYYNKFNSIEQTFSIAYIVSLISSHFLIYTASRLMLPFSILTPFVQTYTLKYIQRNDIRLIFIIYSLLIAFRWFYNTMFTESYYNNWDNMQTILNASYWL